MILLPAIVQSVARLAKPWAAIYGDSRVLSSTVTFAHVAGLLFGGGLAIASDRATLRAMTGSEDDRSRVLIEIASTHRWILTALSVIFVSGLGLALSDVKTFATSPVYWTKMGLVVLLLINGAALQRTEQRLRAADLRDQNRLDIKRQWSRLRLTAIASMTLWTSIALAGVILVEAS
jgi:hypothetical protein